MDRKLAAELARFSALIYPIEEIEKTDQARISHALSPASVKHFNRDDTQAFLVETERWFALVFRGTQVSRRWSWGDVKRNMRMAMVPWNGVAKVHAGYAAGLRAVANDITQALNECWLRETKSLYITGHSLGGATATLAAALFRPTATYTFGAPRAGNKDLRRIITPPLYRIVHARDIAPRYPNPAFGYRHAGEHWHLDRDSRLRRCRAGWWEQLTIPFTTKGITVGVLDHRIGEYAAKLEGPELN